MNKEEKPIEEKEDSPTVPEQIGERRNPLTKKLSIYSSNRFPFFLGLFFLKNIDFVPRIFI